MQASQELVFQLGAEVVSADGRATVLRSTSKRIHISTTDMP